MSKMLDIAQPVLAACVKNLGNNILDGGTFIGYSPYTQS